MGDNIIYWIEMCYIRATPKQSSNVSTQFGYPFYIIFFCNIMLVNYFLISEICFKNEKKIS